MGTPGAIWVDDRDPIYRRGIVAHLQGAGYTIAGESSRLLPEPKLSEGSVLIFDVDASGIASAAALVRGRDVRLVGLVREDPRVRLRDPRRASLSAMLVPRALTPARLVSCVRALTDDGGAAQPAATRGLTERELHVLRRLADGDTTRDVAARMNYSERTVKNIVHDLLAKLDCRTRAHAVALAARRGVI